MSLDFFFREIEPSCTVYENAIQMNKKMETGKAKPDQSMDTHLTLNDVLVGGDVKIEVHDKHFNFHFWFNTAFVEV